MTPEERAGETVALIGNLLGWTLPPPPVGRWIADAIRAAVAREREACCKAVRANCPACGGSGVGGYEAVAAPGVNPEDPCGEPIPVPDRQPYECEYCGRIIAAIRARGGKGA